MIRLFKHYIPHAVVLLWLVDIVVLFASSEIAWSLRADQIDLDIGPIAERALLVRSLPKGARPRATLPGSMSFTGSLRETVATPALPRSALW